MKTIKLHLFALTLFVLSPLCLLGSGLAILEQSVPGLGRALSGMTASYDDPSGLYYNPAAAAWCDHPVLMTGTHWLTGDVSMSPNHKSTPGRGSGDIVRQTFIPNLDLTLPITDSINFNTAMSATSGTSVHFRRDWFGKYAAVDNDVAVLEIQPSISWRIADDVAIAAGLLIDKCDMTIQQYLPTAPYGGDTWMRSKGDTWAFGFNLGIVWRPTKTTTLGVGYRSRTKDNFRMRTRFKRIPAALGLGSSMTDWGDMNVNMPQTVNFGIRQEITDRLTLMADACWTQWSVMRELKMKFDHGFAGQKVSTETMHWHDSWRFALGGEYKLTEKWTLRAGAAFDQRAVSKPQLKVCKLPDSHRYWLTCGASYQWNEHLRLDAAFCHLFFHPSKIDQTAGGTRIAGKFTGYTNLLSLGLRYDF